MELLLQEGSKSCSQSTRVKESFKFWLSNDDDDDDDTPWCMKLFEKLIIT
jgi:hypothetical protein